MQHVSAPWLRTVSCLAGCAPEAPSDWPTAQRRVVRLGAEDVDAEKSPELSRADAAVLEALRAGFTSPVAIASHVRRTSTAVSVQLHRMAKRGLARQLGRGVWAPACHAEAV